jgi:hypothetical protein
MAGATLVAIVGLVSAASGCLMGFGIGKLSCCAGGSPAEPGESETVTPISRANSLLAHQEEVMGGQREVIEDQGGVIARQGGVIARQEEEIARQEEEIAIAMQGEEIARLVPPPYSPTPPYNSNPSSPEGGVPSEELTGAAREANPVSHRVTAI